MTTDKEQTARYESAVHRLVSQVRIRKHYDNQGALEAFQHEKGCRLCDAMAELARVSSE